MDVKEEPEDGSPSVVQRLRTGDPKDVLFLPLYGPNAGHAVCSVLRIEGVTCLLDCGWTEACDVDMLAPLAAVAPYVDVVLLSHADIAHTGALPYACAHLGLSADVYATLPVQHMGHLYLYELLAGKQDVSDFAAFSFDDVDAAFDRIQGVRFSQQVFRAAKADDVGGDGEGALAGARLADIRLTAHRGGHSLGGALWHISVQGQDFVYAVAINLKTDNHLRGCAIQQTFHRPALLITDALCEGRADPDPAQDRAFCGAVVAALRQRGGHVMVPVDTASRVLELLLILEAHWAAHKLQYPLVFLCKTGFSVLAKAKAQLEFLSDKVQQQFTRGKGGNPFELPHVHVTAQLESLNTLPNRANLVVLAPTASLDVGLARELLFAYGWAADPKNSIILPFGGGPAGSVAARLATHAAAARPGVPLKIELDMGFRVDLTSEEVAERRAAEEAAAEAARLLRAQAGEAADAEMVEDVDTPDDPGLATGRENTASVAQQTAGGAQTRGATGADAPRADAAMDGVLIDGFKVPEGAVAPMFPFPDEPLPVDEFGAVADLVALCGRHYYGDDDDLDGGVDGATAKHLEADLDLLPLLEQRPTKVVRETRLVEVHAAVVVFDFSSIISQSSFLSMVKHVAPRNLVLASAPVDLDAAGLAAGLAARLDEALRGLYCHVHAPAASEVLTLPSTACYIAHLTPGLNAAIDGAAGVVRGPYRLGWLDAVVVGRDPHTGNPLLAAPPEGAEDAHTCAGVFLGNMMVSDVTRRLKEAALRVEQEAEAALVNGGEVIVRHDDSGGVHNGLVIEGGLSPLFFQVRDAVYAQYRLVN